MKEELLNRQAKRFKSVITQICFKCHSLLSRLMFRLLRSSRERGREYRGKEGQRSRVSRKKREKQRERKKERKRKKKKKK
ncbi:hypothetical protein PUN28_010849 [Cardiocondyla obscurior]|uniref:Uncharacterized protein n=1 Tax=Cardiocondyla obscurior TaxID=286306 RepID=A0AAW2FKB0_9HYME